MYILVKYMYEYNHAWGFICIIIIILKNQPTVKLINNHARIIINIIKLLSQPSNFSSSDIARSSSHEFETVKYSTLLYI